MGQNSIAILTGAEVIVIVCFILTVYDDGEDRVVIVIDLTEDGNDRGCIMVDIDDLVLIGNKVFGGVDFFIEGSIDNDCSDDNEYDGKVFTSLPS